MLLDFIYLVYLQSWPHFAEDCSITNVATPNIVLFALIVENKTDHPMRISRLIYSQNIFWIFILHKIEYGFVILLCCSIPLNYQTCNAQGHR